MACALAIAGTFSTASCGNTLGCPELCKAEAECCSPEFGCDPDTRDMDSCVSTCEGLIAKDPAFADTVDAQAGCYQTETCEDIRFQGICADP